MQLGSSISWHGNVLQESWRPIYFGVVRWFVIAGRGPPYSAPQCWDHVAVQCACPGRGGEMVGVYDVCSQYIIISIIIDAKIKVALSR